MLNRSEHSVPYLLYILDQHWRTQTFDGTEELIASSNGAMSGCDHPKPAPLTYLQHKQWQQQLDIALPVQSEAHPVG